MTGIFPKILCCSVLALMCSVSFPQELNPIKKFADTLIAAKTEEERNAFLSNQKDLVTVELRKTLIAEGEQLRVRSDFPSALIAFELAKKVAELIEDKPGIAEALFNIANINRVQGDIGLALENTKKCLDIANHSGDKSLIARSLLYIGIFYRFQGDNDQALINTNKAMEFSDQLSEKEVALGWNNIGTAHLQEGNFISALKYLEKALTIREKLGDKDAIAGSLNNIAVAYDRQGSIEEALAFYKRSLKIREELGDKANIANVMNNMGDVRLLGSYELALEYNKKSLALAEEIGDKPLIARALGNIGNAYVGIGDFDHALEYSNKGLNLAQEIGDKEVIANELLHISHSYYGKNEYEKSLNYAKRSTALAKEIGGRQQLWTALTAEGDCYRKLNSPDVARKSYEDAIDTIEDWRSLVAGGELEQQSLFSEKLSAYHGMIELMIEQNQIADAFTFAEKAKARTLLDVLHSGKVDIAKEMTTEEHLQEAKWNQDLVSLNRDLENEKLSSNPDKNRIALLDSQLQTARLDYDSFRSKLYTSHPELRVRRGEIEAIRPDKTEQLFPERSAILEYVVTDENTYLFVLKKDNDDSSVHTNIHTIKITEDKLVERIQTFRKQISNRDANFAVAAHELYTLLIKPAQQDLAGSNKLIVVPDDVLWELPFQTLESAQNRFLLEDYSISLIPSLTVLREMKSIRKPQHESKDVSLLAFGNPSLGNDKAETGNVVYRNAGLQPLPEAEKEVKTLAKIYGSQQSKVYVESQAREDYFKTEANQFQVLHLATHGILNDASPMYSYLALAQGNSETEDGMLEAREIMNLNLKADLVVLSACDTALGKIGKGEGMIGLSWALFVAGTPATLVSQWKVHSASTTDLMLAFHRNLKAGEGKAYALRSAALNLAKSPYYNHPFYWAPFVLIGDGF
jgi:CHAT domain-containing protein/Tfp pilus assembly protein PilF